MNMATTTNNHTTERVAVVEVQLANQTKTIEDFAERQKEHNKMVAEAIKGFSARFDKMENEITHYKGFIGGIALILSGIGILFTFFKQWLFTKLGTG